MWIANVGNMMSFELELKQVFLEEAQQMLQEAEGLLLSLDKGGEVATINESLFRISHNIKGSAASAGFQPVSETAHLIENLLLKLRKVSEKPSPPTMEVLFLGFDCLYKYVEGALDGNDNESILNDARSRLVNMVDDAEEPPQKAAESQSSFEIWDPAEAQPKNAAKDIEKPKEPVAVAAVGGGEGASAVEKENQASLGSQSLRVRIDKIDKLVNNVGELVVLDSMLYRSRSEVKSEKIRALLSELTKTVREIREDSLSLRMVSMKATFQRLQRVARDTATGTDKEIDMSVVGEHIELDKTIVELIKDPLVHIVRNAVDHGIELPSVREKIDKKRAGQISISASHGLGVVEIVVKDDGKGLSAEKLVQKAVAKGIIPPNANLPREKALELIFEHGFSTREQATDFSGRGVGMDVVKTNIEHLRGTIRVNSTEGQGSVFSIILPTTLAIIEALTVRVGQKEFLVPISQVQETVSQKNCQIMSAAGGGSVVMLRGEALPLYRLGKILGSLIDRTSKFADKAVIVVQLAEDDRVAIMVDDIVEQMQVVVKKLGEELSETPGLSGAAIMENGNPVPILNIFELINRVRS